MNNDFTLLKIYRGIEMRQKIQSFGKFNAVILFTVLSIIIAITLDFFIAYVLSHDLKQPDDLIRATIITLVIAPFVFRYVFDLYIDIETLEKEKTDLDTYDNLTGLFNRTVFYEACEKSHHYSVRNKQPYCILVVEIDDFKNINEKYGIAGGNRVLEIFGQVALVTVRDSDILARLGGEEFAFFLPNTNVEQAQILADRLCDHIKKKAVIHDGTKYIKYTVSIGISINQHNKAISLEKGLKMADDALSVAQEKGGNCTEIYSRKTPAV